MSAYDSNEFVYRGLYPKYELEFYDLLLVCVDYMEKIEDVGVKVKFNNQLNRVFIVRQRGPLMKLFRDLYNYTLKEGDYRESNEKNS